MEVAKEVAEDLGLGIASYLNLVNPAAVILGGGLMAGFFFHMIDDITRSVQGNALAEVATPRSCSPAHSDAGIAMGAALLFHPEDQWPYSGHTNSAVIPAPGLLDSRGRPSMSGLTVLGNFSVDHVDERPQAPVVARSSPPWP